MTIDSVLLIDNNIVADGITVTDILADTIYARTLGGNVTINGVLCKDSGITLLTSGGTATALDYYEEYTHTTNFTCTAWTAAISRDITIIRIGKEVTLTFPAIQSTGSTGLSSSIAMSTVLPVRFRHVQVVEINPVFVGHNDGTLIYCRFALFSSGALTIFNDLGGSFTSTGGSSGPRSASISYST